MRQLTLRKPIRHGCGEALRSFSNLSQNSSGSTLVSTSSWINVRTFLSTAFGSLDDSSKRFARNFRHFSFVVSAPCLGGCAYNVHTELKDSEGLEKLKCLQN